MENIRVVITGLGAITPIGNTVNAFWQNLLVGKMGAGLITKFDSTHFKTKFACELKDFDVANFIDKKEIRKTDPFVHYALAACHEAITDSNLLNATLDYNKIGVIWASGNGGITSFEQQVTEHALGNGIPKYNPYFMPKILVDIAAGYISMHYGFRGVNYCPVSACASATTAIIDAYNYIKLGYANVIIAGGSEAPITQATIGGFGVMKALSTNNNNYKTASRPFDISRDGFVMGEGAGALVLESLEHAKKRGAIIIAEVMGGGMSADAYHLTASHPDGLGAILAMQQACEISKIDKHEINYINLHATSTPVGDLSEINALHTFYNGHVKDVALGATKSMTGHLLGASGAIEAIVCAMSVNTNKIPENRNLQNIDSAIQLNVTNISNMHKTVNIAMSNNFGFGGHNACLVLKKFEY